MPIDAGHPNVEEHDVRAEFADSANGLDAIEGYGRSMTRPGRRFVQNSRDVRLIVNDQDADPVVGHDELIPHSWGAPKWPPNPPSLRSVPAKPCRSSRPRPPRGPRNGPPNPPAFGASRRSPGAPLDRARRGGPETAPQPPSLRSVPAKPCRSSRPRPPRGPRNWPPSVRGA